MMLRAVTGTTVRTVTPTNFAQYTTLEMGTVPGGDAVQKYARLLFMHGEWSITSPINLATTGTDHDDRHTIYETLH